MRRCVWQQPDGSLAITTFVSDDPASQAKAIRDLQGGHLPPGTTIVLDGDRAEVDAKLPADLSQRNKWRFRNGVVVVDATIPDPPDPVAARRAAIESATTIAALKAALLAE